MWDAAQSFLAAVAVTWPVGTQDYGATGSDHV
jgi:hypothetical protein